MLEFSAPCSLPMGWGGWFLVGCLLAGMSFLAAGMVVNAKAGTLDIGDPSTYSPFKPQLQAVGGLGAS
eukprot:SAG22_NODE_560_length_9102_cov_54.310785_5_plen_68_part_00